jgi:hypothetical protein
MFLNGDSSSTEVKSSPFIPLIYSLPSPCSLHQPKALAPRESHHGVIIANIFVKRKVRPLKKGASNYSSSKNEVNRGPTHPSIGVHSIA